MDKHRRIRRRGLVLVAATATLVLGLAGCGGGSGQLTTTGEPSTETTQSSRTDTQVWNNGVVALGVGDCFRTLQGSSDDAPFDAKVVSCAEPHDAEVVSVDCKEAGFTESDSVESARMASELYASYVGLQESPGGVELSDWLTNNGLLTRGAWDHNAGCLSYLAGEDGELTQSYRSAAGS